MNDDFNYHTLPDGRQQLIEAVYLNSFPLGVLARQALSYNLTGTGAIPPPPMRNIHASNLAFSYRTETET
jgi:hypothetical protein